MATEVKLPDLGEGITDVTINRWRFKEGESVNAGDVLLEVATDKVDTEVNAPASGTLLKISAKAGEVVDIKTILALIGAAGEQPSEPAAPVAAATPAKESAAPPSTPDAAPAPEPVSPTTAPSSGIAEGSGAVSATPVALRLAAEKGIDLGKLKGSGPGGRITKEDVLAGAPAAESAAAASPAPTGLPGDLADVPNLVVRRLAAENGVELHTLANGRPLSTLTKYDVLSAVAGKPVEPRFAAPQGATHTPAAAAPSAPATSSDPTPIAPSSAPAPAEGKAAPTPGPANTGDELIPHTRMRQAIARNTLQSVQGAPHVTSMWDVDMSTVIANQKAQKAEFAKAGVKLTLTAYLVQAVVAGLKAVPAANATWTDEGVLIKRHYNIGMAVAIPMDQNGLGGLIVPVIKNVGDLSLAGVAKAVNQLADKARANKLTSEDLQGGTFTLSNYGTSGSRFQTPIIVQPQVGILGTGVIEKRPVVVSNGSPLEANMGDYLTFKPMMTLGFSYDHRVLDGATADAFCAAVKKTLETWA